MAKMLNPLFLYCESPLHAGSGSDLGLVDLPIQREKHTGFPKIEGSSLKGSLRESFENLETFSLNEKSYNGAYIKKAVTLTFGPEEGELFSGAIGFSDARLLCLPVKSMKGVFAWITCPMVLAKFNSEMKRCGITCPPVPPVNSAPNNCSLYVNKGNKKIILEEYTFTINGDCTDLAQWLAVHVLPQREEYKYWQEKIKSSLVVVSDDDFRDFSRMSTEVITRIKINNETGTVSNTGLFTEEYLPSESILYALVIASPVFNEDKSIFSDEKVVLRYFTDNLPATIQLGASATIGKGIIAPHHFVKEEKK